MGVALARHILAVAAGPDAGHLDDYMGCLSVRNCKIAAALDLLLEGLLLDSLLRLLRIKDQSLPTLSLLGRVPFFGKRLLCLCHTLEDLHAAFGDPSAKQLLLVGDAQCQALGKVGVFLQD